MGILKEQRDDVEMVLYLPLLYVSFFLSRLACAYCYVFHNALSLRKCSNARLKQSIGKYVFVFFFF